jgi:hypothetical protein
LSTPDKVIEGEGDAGADGDADIGLPTRMTKADIPVKQQMQN